MDGQLFYKKDSKKGNSWQLFAKFVYIENNHVFSNLCPLSRDLSQNMESHMLVLMLQAKNVKIANSGNCTKYLVNYVQLICHLVARYLSSILLLVGIQTYFEWEADCACHSLSAFPR